LFGRENQMIFADLEPMKMREPIVHFNGPVYDPVTPGSWYAKRQAWNTEHPEFFEPVEEVVVE